MITLNAPTGLGDAIYVRAIVLHLLAKGERVTVLSRWPAVFSDLPVTVNSERQMDVRAPESDVRHVTACLHCQIPAIMALDKFSLACLQAGIVEPVALKMDWKPRNPVLLSRIAADAAGRDIVLYQPLRRAGNLAEQTLRPMADAYRGLIAERQGSFRIRVGHPNFTEDVDMPCELDLIGRIAVEDALDIATVADEIIGENCYLPVVAQALGKPFVCMFSKRGLSSPFNKVRGVTPERSFHPPHLGRAVFDE